MKTIRKMMALVIAMVMVVAMANVAMAATIKTGAGGDSAAAWAGTGPASITVTLPTVPTGSTANNTYHIYKVFDATVSGTNIAYTLVDGKTTAPTGFTVKNGYVTHGDGTATDLTSDEISAIASYISSDTPVVTVTTTASDTSFTVDGLDYGYYYIDTTVGTLVTVTSTNPNGSVNDKNEVPPVNKKITGATGVIDNAGKKAIAQVGTPVEYTGTVTKKKGAENYTFKDKMDDGLTFNDDVKVYNADPAGKTEAQLAEITVATSNYTVGAAGCTGDGAYTFNVAFDNTYMAGLADDTVLYIVYSGTINNNALTIDAEKNTAWLEYGDENSPNSTPKVEVEVYSAKITVTKKDGSTSGAGLAGAGFVLKNGNDKYYKKTAGSPDKIEWVDSIDDATEFTSDSTGALDGEFTGLIPGNYTLIEKTVPNSYNKCDDVSFTITNSDYTAANLEQSTIVVNEQGSILPSTGGIGTTIFYIVGAILVIGAGILLVTRRRMSAN